MYLLKCLLLYVCSGCFGGSPKSCRSYKKKTFKTPHRKISGYTPWGSLSAMYPEFFIGMGFEFFLYEPENLGGFWDFFLKNHNKLKKIQKR